MVAAGLRSLPGAELRSGGRGGEEGRWPAASVVRRAGAAEGQTGMPGGGAPLPSFVERLRLLLMPGWGRRSQLCRVSRVEVWPVRSFPEPRPFPSPSRFFRGKERAIKTLSQCWGCAWVSSGISPPLPALRCFPSPTAVNLGKGLSRAICPESISRLSTTGVIAGLFLLDPSERFKREGGSRVGVAWGGVWEEPGKCTSYSFTPG